MATQYTISNIAGGNARRFRLVAGNISMAAVRHANGSDMIGGPVFGGPAKDDAEAAYAELYQQYLDGECDEEVTRIIQGR